MHNLDPSRIAYFDETGSTASNDCRQSVRNKTFNTRGRPAERQSPEYKNIKRITMMPVVFANGDIGLSLFVVQGTRVTYRTTLHDGMETMVTPADCLPRGSVITTRQDVASVDSHNVLQWGKLFAEDCRDLTARGRKVLLILDGYREHMTYPVLHLFDASGIIVYALPAHTSGSTQPLYVSVFDPFKEHLRVSIEELSSPAAGDTYDVFDYLKIMREAFYRAFTRSNIMSGLKNSGIRPLGSKVLLGVPRPESSYHKIRLLSVR